jgi:mRNA-degrading endonuclease RelE of RelBE toxin-antitoxin system
VNYQVGLTESAQDDIEYYEARDQRIIVAGIIAHLKVDAEVPAKRRKQLRSNPIAPWELRLDRFRVFYSIEETTESEGEGKTVKSVKVVAVGHKEHNELFIRGEKVEL